MNWSCSVFVTEASGIKLPVKYCGVCVVIACCQTIKLQVAGLAVGEGTPAETE